ncbi:MAG TPA: phosphoglycerate kinase [Longimicrobiales bacterium]|nr:phosphoglycerate kinase [Longimicrobiales bacterium]
MNKKSIESMEAEALRGKRVLVRVDYNVPIEDGAVTDDTRIRATLPTLQFLTDAGARVVLVSHLGRPKGKWRDEMSMAPAAARLRELIDVPVRFIGDVVGGDAKEAADALAPGSILVLENVRFLAGEETNDPKLSEALAGFADIYVNDAFGSAHRAHASTCGVAEVMKENGRPAVAGMLMEKELRFLGGALENPERPFAAILGGAKISGKIDVIESLLPRVEHLLIGGAMANTFFRALGLETGKSLVEEERVGMARTLLERAGSKIVLPVDCVVAGEAKAGARTWLLARDEVPPEGSILDIGPKSVATFRDFVERSRTILWNGPMGLFEIDDFAEGTQGVARAVADMTARGATTIVGGGDTAAAVEEAGLADRMSHVSTGGGASLEFLEGRTLPGVAILDDEGGAA